MRTIQHGEQFARRAAKSSWCVIAFRLVATDGKKPGDCEHVITVTVNWPTVAGEKEPCCARSTLCRLFVAVAAHAKRVQDRLHIAWKINDIRHIIDRLNLGGRLAQCVCRVEACAGGLRTMFVTTNAANHLTRLHAGETLHPLDSHIILIKRNKKNAA